MKYSALVVLSLASLLCAAAAPAPDPHAIDLTTVLKTESGDDMPDCAKFSEDGKTCEKQRLATIGHAIAHALFASYPDEQSLSGEQKFARGELAWRIEHADTITLSPEDVVTIKRCVGKAYAPLVVKQIYPVIDPTLVPPKLQ